MKILTVGASPFLLVRDGRMNADILRMLKKEGHTIGSAVWHHDKGYFLPDDNGISYFEDTDKNIVCELYELPSPGTEAALYETMKKFQPQMIITIGDYKQIDFVYSIKAMYPNLFKWVAIYPTECLWINESYRDRLEYADYSICTSKFGWNNLSEICNVSGEFLPYGPDFDAFEQRKIERSEATFFTSAHNSQSSNLAAFIRALALAGEGRKDILGKIHTNLHDAGDYDLNVLVDRYGATNVTLPDYYCSIREGISASDYCKLLSDSDFYVETSVKSATGLCMLEAMASGCIPVGMRAGRVGEIISMMPKEYQFFVDHEIFIGSFEEEYSIISTEGLGRRIEELKRDVFDNKQKYVEASLYAQQVAKNLSVTHFLRSLSSAIKTVAQTESSVAVESF